MHNKLMVMDNAIAIVGGRNIGDHYFQVHTEANFRDLDVAAGGPVVREISAVFDHFWNGEWAVPISALVDRPYTEADLRAALRDHARAHRGGGLSLSDRPGHRGSSSRRSRRKSIDFIWAPGQIVWDDPAEIVGDGRHQPDARGVAPAGGER